MDFLIKAYFWLSPVFYYSVSICVCAYVKLFILKIITIFICFQNQVQDFRKANNNIVVENFDKESKAKFLNPVMTFEQAFFNYPDIMSTINKQGFFKPSPIQAQAWPYLLSGKDLIGIAQTGTGKTLAFLVSVF